MCVGWLCASVGPIREVRSPGRFRTGDCFYLALGVLSTWRLHFGLAPALALGSLAAAPGSAAGDDGFAVALGLGKRRVFGDLLQAGPMIFQYLPGIVRALWRATPLASRNEV